ncbi:hypothetical protein BJ741DRAFT_603980 [Chytriomyces cf. hyalinus JEL632]|nr:hypothetical protein BJ741DRAFT_603980 [Chytriomyces cf. hyalinus JEL632]
MDARPLLVQPPSLSDLSYFSSRASSVGSSSPQSLHPLPTLKFCIPSSSDHGQEFAAPSKPDSQSQQPVKKGKAGRKFATDEPANKRIAQNRASQRSYQERKQAHLKSLEAAAAFCQANHVHLGGAVEPSTQGSSESLQREVIALRKRVADLEAENARLSIKAESVSSTPDRQTTMDTQGIINQLLMPSGMDSFLSNQEQQQQFITAPLDPLLATNPFSDTSPYIFGTPNLLSDSAAQVNFPVSNLLNLASPDPATLRNPAFETISNSSPYGTLCGSPTTTFPSPSNSLQRRSSADFSAMDCLDCSQRMAVNREMLKNIKSLQVKENGEVLVDELCDLMENFCVKCKECEANSSVSKEIQLNENGVPADEFSVSLLKVIQSRFKVLEACDNEDDRERIIDLMLYSRRRNTNVRKNFGRIVSILRQALSSIVDPLVNASGSSMSGDALLYPFIFDLSTSSLDAELRRASQPQQAQQQQLHQQQQQYSHNASFLIQPTPSRIAFDLTTLDAIPLGEQAPAIKIMLKSLESFKYPQESLIVDEFVDLAKHFFETCCQESGANVDVSLYEDYHREQAFRLYHAKFELLQACKTNEDHEHVMDLINYTRNRSDYFQTHYDRFLSSLKEALRI